MNTGKYKRRDNLDRQIFVTQFLVIKYFLRCTSENNLSRVQYNGTVGKLQGCYSILFNQYRGYPVALNLQQGTFDVMSHDGRAKPS